MKTVRFVAVFTLAVALFVTAVLPLATTSVSLPNFALNTPAQSFVEAARGLPLLSPMSAALPVISLRMESAAGSQYACSLVSQKPKDWTKMKGRQIFDATWTVKNSGTKAWSTTGTDFKYISGTKMHTYSDAYDLSASTGAGKKITLVVDMIAPKAKGYYTAVWGLSNGSTTFCKLSVTINVNR